jgi:hypothetical protein
MKIRWLVVTDNGGVGGPMFAFTSKKLALEAFDSLKFKPFHRSRSLVKADDVLKYMAPRKHPPTINPTLEQMLSFMERT